MTVIFSGPPPELVPPAGTNRLAKFRTVAVTGPDGPTHGILLSVDAPHPETFSELMPEIVHNFRCLRMASPTDTSFLLITVIGAVSASEFKRLWKAHSAGDQIVEFWLSQMTKADVLHGTPDGKPLDCESLLE